MATFDQFANQGGAAAGDESEAAAAQAEADTADQPDELEEPDAL